MAEQNKRGTERLRTGFFSVRERRRTDHKRDKEEEEDEERWKRETYIEKEKESQWSNQGEVRSLHHSSLSLSLFSFICFPLVIILHHSIPLSPYSFHSSFSIRYFYILFFVFVSFFFISYSLLLVFLSISISSSRSLSTFIFFFLVLSFLCPRSSFFAHVYACVYVYGLGWTACLQRK